MAISLVILFGFQKFYKRPSGAIVPPGKMTQGPIVRPQPGETQERPAAKAEEPIEEKIDVVQTDRFTLAFSDIGGTLKSIQLRDYQDAEGKEQSLYEAPQEGGLFSTVSENFPGAEKSRYKISRGSDFIEYKYVEPGQVEVKKRYNFYNSFNYMDLRIQIKNISPKDISFSYEMSGPSDLTKTDKVMGRRFLGADAMVDDKILRKKSVKGAVEIAGNVAWVALKNRYFALALKPFDMSRAVIFRESAGKGITTALKSRAFVIGPGEKMEDTYLVYAGELDAKKLTEVGYGLEGLIDYGIFGGISKFLLTTLRFFHKWTRNWGVSILLLTMLINAALFPLTRKSVTSMHQMKMIQPHMQKLKELHKDNPNKLNKEMMELYKKYNVNPLSGCLPLLLQMPVFISLYQGLIRSVELKGAHFLWIKDLSRPDAVPLPISLPFIGASINILPLIMIVMMAVQQKISQGASAAAMTGDQASQQKMMMVIFPVVFGFLFYNMPAGLVLYWLTNTILMTAEQKLLGKNLAKG